MRDELARARTPEQIAKWCDDYDLARARGAKIAGKTPGPGYLVDCLRTLTPIVVPDAGHSAKFYTYVCIECGEVVERTSKPSDWPRHISESGRSCGGPLLFQPADENERRLWAKEIAQIERLQKERSAQTAEAK